MAADEDAIWREFFDDSDSDEDLFEGFMASDIDGEMDSEDVSESDVDVPTPGVSLSDSFEDSWLHRFDKRTSVLLDTDGTETVFEIFCKFLDEDFISMLTIQTNLYTEQYFEKHPKDTLPPCSTTCGWVPVVNTEMKSFLGILLFMGAVKLPNYASYWSTNALTQMKGFREIMSRDRWQIIWMFFHVCDNTTNLPRDHPNHGPTFKIRPVVDKLIERFRDIYYPEKELSVDESLIAFKGRMKSMGQYMPQKPHKWGLKAWVLCESSTGYCYNWFMYVGRKQNTEVGLTNSVVKDAGHHVYMDNFFSSPHLFKDLSECSVGACGTLRANRRGTPPQIQRAKLKKGDDPMFVRDDKCLFIAWMDKKQVNVLSTINNTRMMIKYIRCRDPANNNRREINKPKAIECYNQFMGGVDLLDQKIWTILVCTEQ
ncbi:piggyBac transposable element-derived protein 4-like [Gigantopelta aegis]|uniref:piggyBac transposable element-derived protein 4-like n=1 Tax=Gigantopelta aegis TaxID=1735272 RepID=UPI001B88D7F5|nr:piggyBac transposable element-derived protein 4-like [Gigantopelta aegis]